MAKKKSKVKSVPKEKAKPAPITGNDLHKIRTMYDLSSIDLAWVMARPIHTVRLSQKGGAAQPLHDRRLSIFARILLHEADPDLIPLPRAPEYEDMFERMEKLWPPKKYKDELSPGKQRMMTRDAFGMLFGVSLCASYAWGGGGPHDPIVDRLFWLVSGLIDKHGKDALEILADIVDKEARSRGIKGGFSELMKNRRWQKS